VALSEKKASIQAASLPRIRGIPPQIYQLFTNLISNSIKFCDGVPEIRTHSRDLEPRDLIQYPQINKDLRYVEPHFTDNGIGFENQYTDQIFIIFHRLHNPQVYSGSGIGLTRCKKIVENHQASITAESTPGVGTTFRVILPRFG